MLALASALSACTASCSPPPPAPLRPGTFAFGVYGDGPYFFWANGRHRRLLADAESADLAWLIHVGDILRFPCSDNAYREHRALLDAVARPVIYTPGHNEWTDCHGEGSGGYDPLDRLSSAIRSIFFDDPATSLGGQPVPLTSQGAGPDFPEAPAHAGVVLRAFTRRQLPVAPVGESPGPTPIEPSDLLPGCASFA